MIVGIDLGTTNSLIGSYVDGKPVLFPNVSGSMLTPSVVSIDAEGVLIGAAARDRLVTHPAESVACFKRWMGTSRETALGGRSFRPEELSSFVLRSLVNDAEAATGTRPTEAVISVPAYFSDGQRNATRIAGEMAGLKVQRLINEPTAAALAYGLEQRDRESRFLIFDLGGGTFDVSIVEIFSGVVEVHASAGDNFLGGEDFLDLLVKTAAEDLAVDLAKLSLTDQMQFRRRIEHLKHHLSSHDQGSIELTIGGEARTWSIQEARFASLAEPLIQRLRQPLERALRDAKLTSDELDEVVLVGGATRMPVVLRSLAKMLGRLPLRHIKPDEVIAFGAITASGLQARNVALEEVILTDVCPYTLGTSVSRQDHTGSYVGGFYLPIIPRSTTVPVSREETLFPINDTQTRLVCDIYQGENPLAEKNLKLGELVVPLPMQVPRAKRGVTLRYTYDINGILQVEAHVPATDARHEVVLERAPGALTPEEIKARLEALADLKIHPRARLENLEVVARLERLYEERLHQRDMIDDMLFDFRRILETQDDRQIGQMREAILYHLDDLER